MPYLCAEKQTELNEELTMTKSIQINRDNSYCQTSNTSKRMETNSESTPTMYATNYYVATHWLANNLILANQLVQNFADDIEFLFDWDEFEENSGEIFQYFLTDCDEDEAEWLNAHFGLMFAYSEKLDLYILCVTHYGTSWDYVYCETDIENAKAELGDRKGR